MYFWWQARIILIIWYNVKIWKSDRWRKVCECPKCPVEWNFQIFSSSYNNTSSDFKYNYELLVISKEILSQIFKTNRFSTCMEKWRTWIISLSPVCNHFVICRTVWAPLLYRIWGISIVPLEPRARITISQSQNWIRYDLLRQNGSHLLINTFKV